MKTIRFVGFLFYKYYSKGATKDIPYFSTLCALAMLIALHVMQLLILIGEEQVLFTKGSKVEKFLRIALWLVPIFVGLRFLVTKEELRREEYADVVIKRGYIRLIIYIVLSVAFLLFLSVAKVKR